MIEHAHLDRIKRSTGTLRMELHAPNLLTRVGCRFDALDRRVVTIDEEGLPALREGILEFERVLMVLATGLLF